MIEQTPIAGWVLILSLFLPRLTLIIAWISNCIPPNTIPFVGDVLMAIFIPRVLILSLFLPRLTLIIAWINNCIPPNTVPFVGDVLMAIFIPRVLILIYIYGCMGLCVWFWLHLAIMILIWITSIFKTSNRG